MDQNWVSILGYIAGFLGTVSYLPQVIKSWRTKRTNDISLLTLIIVSLGACLWLAYGLLTDQAPLSLWNSAFLVLALSLVLLKIKYG